jgi:hypothetical protein
VSDNKVLQLNFKVGNAMVNAYADSPEEAESLLDWVNQNGDAVIKVQTMLDATHAVAAGLGGSAMQSQQPRFSGGEAPQGGVAPCDHGHRVFKSGTNTTTGKSWQGYFCPSNVKDCKPVWSKG